jgi:tRNA(His) 5'-end guanylyltransferase
MAKSRFEYVRQFELGDSLLPGCCLVVRVDGHRFTRFVKTHSFVKPNDVRGLHLMNEVREAGTLWQVPVALPASTTEHIMPTIVANF